jgi:phage-related minor tail protein
MTPDTSPIDTWTIAVDADISGLESGLKLASGAGRQFSSALVNAFEGLATKGKSFGDVLSGLATSLSKIALQSALKPLEQGLGNLLSGGLSGGGGFGFNGGGAFAFANGGAFSQGVPIPFAAGGVIQSPIAFPLGGGQTGIAGERGAEAIMPLARGPDGRLGVAASGGGGSGMTVNFTVTATDAQSFMRSEMQVAAMLSRAVTLGQRNL